MRYDKKSCCVLLVKYNNYFYVTIVEFCPDKRQLLIHRAILTIGEPTPS